MVEIPSGKIGSFCWKLFVVVFSAKPVSFPIKSCFDFAVLWRFDSALIWSWRLLLRNKKLLFNFATLRKRRKSRSPNEGADLGEELNLPRAADQSTDKVWRGAASPLFSLMINHSWAELRTLVLSLASQSLQVFQLKLTRNYCIIVCSYYENLPKVKT